MDFVIHHSYLIPLLPLIGAAISGFFGAKYLKQQSHWPIWIGVGASAVLSIVLMLGMLNVARSAADGAHAGAAAREGDAHNAATVVKPGRVGYSVTWFSWIQAGDPSKAGTSDYLDASAGAWLDPLSSVMLCVVTGIGFLITVFAAGYMKGEEGYFRFFAYLGLFIFAMTILVMGNNLIMLYLGWEGVGLCSYLLIGYYYEKPAAREAAKKAFLVNRIGDFGFGLGIMLSFLTFGTVSYFGADAGATATGATPDGLLEKVMLFAPGSGIPGSGLTDFQQTALFWIPFLLMLGAFGKSAQFPLHVWLPDAMEGPTPVSALIHAATMVTAGVYMIARCSTLFVQNEAALVTVAVIGAFTAIFAATIALRQFDLKKVFAYSTISQLGFMFVAVGVLAPVAGVFHLVTHAFFKALLFLSSGVVMHAMAGELDMRKMSGLKRVLPKTRILMLIGCLALAGCPPFSGFWSKDEIVVAAFDRHKLLGVVLLVTAFLTAYYSFRLYFRVFEGPEIIPPAPPVADHAAQAAHAPDTHGRQVLTGHHTSTAAFSDSPISDPTGHAHASAAAVQTGTASESGVDTHLAHDTAHHGGAAHGHGHDAHHHNHEPLVMMLPLFILAIGAVAAGGLNTPWAHYLGEFLGQSPSFAQGFFLANYFLRGEVDPLVFGQHGEHTVHVTAMLVSSLVAILGILVAYLMHLKDRPRAEALATRFGGVTRLLEAKYWVDEVYQNVIVEPLRDLGRAFFAADRLIVDGLVWMISFIPQLSGFALKLTVQRGYLQGYAAAMLFGVAVILLVVFL